MRTDLFDYHLPSELIAQTPGPRGHARMLVLHRADGRIEHRHIGDLPQYLRPGDVLALNDTRVSARRIDARRENGMHAEVLLLRPTGATVWEALIKPARTVRTGRLLELLDPASDRDSVTARVVGVTRSGSRLLEIGEPAISAMLGSWGVTPLPPYIRTALSKDQEDCYQTVYARYDGSAAAPTAGLHFTAELLSCLERQGVQRADLTLHVGIDTFRPVRVNDVEDHEMHGETVSVSVETADRINRATGRVVAVGTTSARALESAALNVRSEPVRSEPVRSEPDGRPPRVAPFHGETHLFITPGYRFRAVDALLTNFHLPKSTLLLLISALAGREAVMAAYAQAIRNEYRFFSFGDAMLIL